MRVIFVTANLPYGTNEAFIIPEIEALMRDGHEVLVVPRSPHGPIVHGGALLRYSQQETLCSAKVLLRAGRTLAARPVTGLRAISMLMKSRRTRHILKNTAVVPKALWLADLAKKWQADHIHCHWVGTTATLAMLASQVSGVPWSFTAHRWDVVENNLLAEKAESASLARFISEDGLRMARENGMGLAPSARVLHMGVSLPPPVAYRSGSWPIVVCPARLVEIKGHRFLLEAWKILRKKGIFGELWLAGDGELRPSLESFVYSAGMENSVRFLGNLPHEELLRVYRDVPVSAVALASLDLGHGAHEGIPVALMEAMSYGVPVVATKTGGTPELVKPGTGFLVPPGDASALAGALYRLLRDEPLRRECSGQARKHVATAHDIRSITAELVSAMQAANARQRQSVSAVA